MNLAMVKGAFALVGALVGVTALLAAKAPPADLAAFAPVTERCWAGEVGQGAIDTHCFEPVFGGAHLRDVHRVELGGKAVYRGETLYTREGSAITFTYWNSLGGIGRGTAVAVDGGIDFTMTMRGSPSVEPQPLASQWRWQGRQSYIVSDAAGKPVVFRRTGERPGR